MTGQTDSAVPQPKAPSVYDAFHFTDLGQNKPTRVEDPYEYQYGFGNRFQSEIIPGTLPVAQNNPQVPRFNLYTEGLTSSAFGAPRAINSSTYMYRCRPSVAHDGFLEKFEHKAHLEGCFLSCNPRVKMMPSQYEWPAFPMPTEEDSVDFIDGLHAVGGSGDANIREGLALYVFMINRPMNRRAFLNADGDYLVVAQLGDLDIQTELGKLYLQPGEIAVIQRGVKFCINPGKNEARGYIVEIWGSSWELPELSIIGGHGNANPRDFMSPVAYMDDPEEIHQPWQIVDKINGEYFAIQQDHSPFDVAAWHGNCVPYKVSPTEASPQAYTDFGFQYDLTKFAGQGSLTIDHTDPSIWTVLTAKSRDPHRSLADFLWFGPKWDVAMNTFRLPYFHRNSASEFIAKIYGSSGGRSVNFQAGGGSYEAGHTPHGGFQDVYIKERRKMVNEPRQIMTKQMTFMLESSRSLLFTEWGLSHGTTEGTDPEVWKKFSDQFSTDETVRGLLQRVKAQKARRKALDEAFYHDEQLPELLERPLEASSGTNGEAQ